MVEGIKYKIKVLQRMADGRRDGAYGRRQSRATDPDVGRRSFRQGPKKTGRSGALQYVGFSQHICVYPDDYRMVGVS